MLLLHAESQLRKFEFEAPSKLVKHTVFVKSFYLMPNSHNIFNKTLLILYIEPQSNCFQVNVQYCILYLQNNLKITFYDKIPKNNVAIEILRSSIRA